MADVPADAAPPAEAVAAPEAPAAPAPAPAAPRKNPYAGPPRAAKAAPAAPAAPVEPSAPASKAQPSRTRTMLRAANEALAKERESAASMRKVLSGYAKSAIESLPAAVRKRVEALAGDDPAKALDLARDFAAMVEEIAPKASAPAPASTASSKPAPKPAENDPDLEALSQYEALQKQRGFILANNFLVQHADAIARGRAKRAQS